jgi:xylulokinase
MEHGDASGTALMNVRTRRWAKPVINAIDPAIAEYLPKLSASDALVGTLRAAVAQKYGFSADVVVSAGGGDNMMGAIGTGNVKAGVVTASFGTSGTIYAHAEEPVVDPTGEIAAFCGSTGGWMPLLCTMNVTTVTEQVRALFNYDHGALADAVAATPAGADGLVMLPYLEGERTPNVPDGSGVYLGLNQQTLKPGHLARSAMEGVTLGMNYGLQRLAELGVKPREIRVTGGGAKSPVWRQIMADVFGVPVVAMVEDEGAALGGAIQAAWAVARQRRPNARISTLTERIVAKDESTRVKPHKGRMRRYQEIQTVQNELSASLRKVFPMQRALTAG